MPDLANRRDREAELATAIVLVFRSADAANLGAFNWPEFRQSLQDAMQGPLANVFSQAAGGMPDMGAADIDSAAAAWATGYAAVLAGQLADRTRVELSAATTEESRLAAARMLFGSARAESIAITEVTRAISAGEQWAAEYAMLAGAVVIGHALQAPEPFWVTAEDDLVCEVCFPLNGQPRESYAGVSPDGPPAHPRCRCFLDWRQAA